MPQPNDLSRSLVALDQDSTIIAVVEMSQSSWLVGGILPGIERQPRKKLEPSPERRLQYHAHWTEHALLEEDGFEPRVSPTGCVGFFRGLVRCQNDERSWPRSVVPS